MKLLRIFEQIPPKYVYGLTSVTAIIYLLFMVASLVVICRERKGGAKTKDYSLALFIPKVFESAFTVTAWVVVSFVRQSRKKLLISTTLFHIALNLAGISLILIPAYGSCYLVFCPAKPPVKCTVRHYYDPRIFIPLYFTTQVLSFVLLYLSRTMTKYRPIEPQPFVFENENDGNQGFFEGTEKMVTVFPLAGLFLTVSFLMIAFFIAGIWQVMKHDQESMSSESITHHIAAILVVLLLRFLLVGIAIYGFKKKKAVFLTTSIFISALCTLVFTISAAPALINDTSDNEKHPWNVCWWPFVAVLVYSLDFLSVRVLFLGKKICENFMRLRIPRSQISMNKHERNLLGKGHFGEVWLGKMKVGSATILIAIKSLKNTATEEMKQQILEEAILLREFDHKNIIRPFGLCMDSTPYLLCMQYMNSGSVSTYLHKQEIREALSEHDLAEIILQVANACYYLEKVGIIHRDIAARNCLISSYAHGIPKPKVVKLTDFGLAKDVKSRDRNIYSSQQIETIPVPHTAPEGLPEKASFGRKTDVWSFGVFAWEVFSWCATPFGKCHPSDDRHVCSLVTYRPEEIAVMVQNQRTLLDLSEPCTACFNDDFRNLLRKCWKYDPRARPYFQEIKTKIKHFSWKHSPCFPFEKMQLRQTQTTSDYRLIPLQECSGY